MASLIFLPNKRPGSENADMKNSFTQSMAWLHTWSGLIIGWLLFVIFVGGTIACFDAELDRWTRPGVPAQVAADANLDAVMQRLEREDPSAHVWYLYTPHPRYPAIKAGGWDVGREFTTHSYDPHSGAKLPDSAGGEFFFTLHYNLHAGTIGMYLVGLAGMMMLVAIVTGVIIHRRIFKDFFTFRPRAGGQRAWLDGHNITGVLGLPFHLMIAYTGVAIFVSSYMLAGVHLVYKSDMEAFFDELAPHPHREEMHKPIPQRAPLAPMLADARERLGGEPWLVSVEHPDDASTVVSIGLDHSRHVAWNHRTAYYDGVTGQFMAQGPKPGSAYHTYQFLGGLHMAQFGSGGLYRWLYFLLGLAGCAMLASGLQVWLEKREKRVAKAGALSGYGLVRVLNLGVVAGMPLATVAMLWANRLIPMEMARRSTWEIYAFCAVWLLAAFWAVLRVRTPARAWRELFAATAVLLCGLPLLNLITTSDRHLGITLANGDWAMAAVDLTALALGALFGLMAWRAGRVKVPARERATSLRTAEEAR